MYEQSKLKKLSKVEKENLISQYTNKNFVEKFLIPVVEKFINNYNNGMRKEIAFSEACDNIGLEGENVQISMKRELASDYIADAFNIIVSYYSKL